MYAILLIFLKILVNFIIFYIYLMFIIKIHLIHHYIYSIPLYIILYSIHLYLI